MLVNLKFSQQLDDVTVMYQEIMAFFSSVSSPVGIYPLKVNNRNSRKRFEIYSNMFKYVTDVILVSLQSTLNIFSYLALLFLLLTLNI